VTAWNSQFGRMVRDLKRVEVSANDAPEQGDHLGSFFQNCWHLKDWIKNDDSLPQDTRNAIVRDAEATESLKFCADLANRFKHYKLTKHVRKGATLWYARCVRNIDAATGEILCEVPVGYTIASQRGTPSPSDAVGFARSLVRDWESVLKRHGLTP
jgi:hypothetical protein